MATNPNAIFQTALSQIPQTQVYNPFTTQEQQAQTANLTQEAQQRQLQNQQTTRQIKNLNAIHQNLPGLLEKSNGAYDDSVRQGLIGAGVDAEEVEKLMQSRLSSDQVRASTAKLQSDVLTAQQAQNEHRRVQAGRVAQEAQGAYNDDGSLDLAKLNGIGVSAKYNDPSFDLDGFLKQASTDPKGFRARMDAAAKVASPELEAEAAGLAHTKSETEQQLAVAANLKSEAETRQYNLQLQKDAIQQMNAPAAPGITPPPAATAGLNKGAPKQDFSAGIRPGMVNYLQRRGLTPDQAEFKEAAGAYDAALAGGEGVKGANDAVTKIVDAAATSRRTRENELAILGPRTQADIQKAVATEVAKAKLAPGAVGGIPDPRIQMQAIGEWKDAEKEFRTKESDSNRILDTVDEIRGGNQEASTLARLEELRSVVNRVNRYELSAPGLSAYRRLSNWLSTATAGKPSDAQLNDIEQVARGQLQGGQEKYAARMNDTDKILGSKFGPNIAPARRAPPPAAGGGGDIITNGKDRYRYKGTGDRSNLQNYDKL